MTKYYVKYDNSGSWTTVSGAKNIRVTKATNYKDDAQFSLPNYFNEVYATWAVRTDVGIQVWVDTTVDYLWFQGQITQVITGDPIEIKCSGIVDRLDWYPVPNGSSKFKIDELLVKTAPIGPSDISLDVWTEEEEDPDYNSSDFIGKYMIISDATLEESNAVMLSEAGSSLVNESSSTNTHVKTQTDDTTTSQAEWDDNSWLVDRGKTEHNTGNPTKMIIQLDAVNDTITKGSDVTKIKIKMKGRTYTRANGADHSPLISLTGFSATCGWSRDGVNIDIPLFSVTNPKPDGYTAVSQEFSFIGDELAISVEPGTTSDYFNEGATFWEDGYIIIQMEYTGRNYGTSRDLLQRIYINYCEVTVYYNSETFDPVSGKIGLINAHEGYNALFAYDENGSINWANRGIAVGDRVTIAEDMNTAFQKVLVGPLSDKPILIIPANIRKGIANEYYGITGHKLFVTLCNYMGYSYWTSYDTIIPEIHADLESNINSNILTGDTVASVNGAIITLTSIGDFDDDEYNGMIVVVTAGDNPGEVFTILDTVRAGLEITLTTEPQGNLVGDTIDIRFPERIYDTDNNPPDDLGVIESQNNDYGGVVVFCNAGQTDIIRSGSAPFNDKIKVIVRKDILTLQEAREVGARWALRLKEKSISIQLTWNYLPTEMPHPGKLYTYKGRKWDGSDHTTVEEFADEVCRRVTASQDGAAGMWEVKAFFGSGRTPGDEALGKAIGDLRIENLLNDATSMTTVQTGVRRHNQLDGRGASDHHVKTVKYTDNEAAAKIALDDLYVKVAGDEIHGPLTFSGPSTDEGQIYLDQGGAGNLNLKAINDGYVIPDGYHGGIGRANGDNIFIWTAAGIKMYEGKVFKSADNNNIIQDLPFSDNWSSYDKEAISGKQLYYKIHSIDDNIEGLRAVQHLQGVWTPAALAAASYKDRRGENIPGVDQWGTGGNPTGWTINEGAGNDISIISDLDNHSFPIEMDRTGTSNCRATKSLTPAVSGIIDFYIGTNTVVGGEFLEIRIKGGSTRGLNLFLNLNAGKLSYFDGGVIDLADIIVNTLYHISIEYETGAGGFKGLAADTFNIYMNGSSIGTDLNFRDVDTTVNQILFITEAVASYKVYIDSLGWGADGYVQWSNYFIALDYPSNPNIGDYYIIDTETEISGIQFKKWDWIVWNGLRWIHITTLQQELTVRVRPGESIQDTIDIVLAAGGGTVMLMEGTHDLAGTPIEINDGDGSKTLRIIGMGNASIIDIGGDVDGFDINGLQIGHLTLKDFAIDCIDFAGGRTAIYINEASTPNNPVIIDNITINGDGTNGIGVRAASENIEIKNCSITNIATGLSATGSYCNIHDNWIKGINGLGIFINGTSDYSTIKDNYVEDCVKGIDCEGKYFLIEGNRIIDSATTAIYVDEDGHGSIVDNIIYDFVDYGIYIDCDHITITSNNIEYGHDGGTTYGIYLHDNTDLCTVVANVITNITTATTGTGIRVKNAANTNDVAGNLINNVDFEYSGQPTTTLRDVKGETKFLSRTNFAGGLTVSAFITMEGNDIGGCGNINPNADNTKNCGHSTAYWNTVYTHNLTGASAKAPPLDIGLEELCSIDFTEQDVEKLKAQFPEYMKEETILDNKPVIGLSIFAEIRLSQKCIKELKEIVDRQAIEIEDLKKEVLK